MTLHTPQLGLGPHKLDDPLRPNEHMRVVQWNRRSSLPSARQRGCFFGCRVALALMTSRYSSNLDIVVGYAIDFANGGLLLEPAGLEYDLNNKHLWANVGKSE
ncbi:alanine--tRNA ligase [Striga asiatica]|uniref:Alanine--tRNA ligase n=1 Tax=Striga asiatica TaxID=4170 RepID=A0A5A7QW66_STRAF|nr:alanine--tRNA ligase [Striga asiatica]